jgi:hypothetical protein
MRPALLLALLAALAGCAGSAPFEVTSPCVGQRPTALAFLAAPEARTGGEAVTRRAGDDCLFTPMGAP